MPITKPWKYIGPEKGTVWELLFLAYAVSLPFGPAIPNLIFGTIVVYWIYCLFTKKNGFNKNLIKPFLLFNGFVLVEIISLAWSESPILGMNKIALHLHFPIFFLVIGSIQEFREKSLIRITMAFIGSVLVLAMLSLLVAFWKSSGSLESLTQNRLAEALIDFHYLGMSLYVALAIVLGDEIILKNPEKFSEKTKLVWVLINIFLLAILFLLGSRSTIMVILLILLFQLYRLWYTSQKIKFFMAVFAVILFSIIMVFSNPLLQNKMKEAINYKDRYHIKNVWGGRGFRELIWNCSLYLIHQEPLFGVGIGDQQTRMEQCYEMHRYTQLSYKGNTFNCHSLYFQTMVSTGIVGLMFFLVAFIFPLKISIQKMEWLYFVLAAVVLGTGITESHFNRNAIVSLYSFFAPLIFFTQLRNESSSTS